MSRMLLWRFYSLVVFIQLVACAFLFPRGFNNIEDLIYSSSTSHVGLWTFIERISRGLSAGGAPYIMTSLFLVILGLGIEYFAQRQDPSLAKSITFATISLAGLPLIGIALSMLCFVVALSGA